MRREEELTRPDKLDTREKRYLVTLVIISMVHCVVIVVFLLGTFIVA